jgi:cytidylate kinase
MTIAGSHSRVIAIDGPAASGKSSVGRALAGRVGAIFLDTGLLYRAVTAEALERGISPTDGQSLTQLVNALDLRIAPASVGDGRAHDVLVDGEDVTGTLRTPEIDANVSAVSEHQGVRDALLPIQRRIADGGKVVMVGRDIASVVVPDAGLKIYLDAGPEIRARRRFLELERKGVQTTYDDVLGDLLRRDEIDSTREIAPLQQARGAIILDTNHLSESEVIDRIETLVLRSWGPPEQAGGD